MHINELIGMNIRKKRKLCNYAQEDFANEIGLSPYYYGKIERGQANPTVSVLSAIADGLDSTIEEIICGEENDIK